MLCFSSRTSNSISIWNEEASHRPALDSRLGYIKRSLVSSVGLVHHQHHSPICFLFHIKKSFYRPSCRPAKIIMQLINLLTLGFLALASVSTLPTEYESDPKTPACKLSGNIYNGAGKECQCPPGQLKKHNKGKCGYAPFSKPKCKKEEKGYCSKSKYEYCGYGT